MPAWRQGLPDAFVSGAEKEPMRIEPASGRGHFDIFLGQMARLYIGRSVSFRSPS